MFLTISIVDTRSSSFDAPQQGEVIASTDISHTLIFYFPNVTGVVQRLVWFVMRPEPKASYRTVHDNTHIVTPLICMCFS